MLGIACWMFVYVTNCVKLGVIITSTSLMRDVVRELDELITWKIPGTVSGTCQVLNRLIVGGVVINS